MGDEPAAKRARLDEDPAPPSAVLHARNLPLDANEYELRQILPNPQQVAAMIVLKGKGQALIQFTDIGNATAALTHFQTNRAQLRHKQVYLQYSRRTELDTVAHQNIQTMNASLSAGGAMFNPLGHLGGPASVPALQAMAAPTRVGCVLHVTISDCFYPIGIDLLVTVFQSYGTLTKIIMLTKDVNVGTTQALIQYADENQANAAREMLNGKQLFDGAGLLRVQTSKFETLKVLYNNERSRDFTATLPYGPPGSMPSMPSQPGMPGAIFSPFGQAQSMPGQLGLGGPSMMPGGMPGMDGVAIGNSPVVLANKLNEDKITTDALFNLFGVYGDVQRVKILFNKRHTALVQMATVQQAQLVVRMLNGVPLYGKPLALTISSHTQVKLPRPDSEEFASKNTVSYEKSEFHRYAIAGSKNYSHIVPPSQVLHLSNIADGVTEEQLKQVFSQFGTVASFRFFKDTQKMAIVTMSSVGEAVDALIATHQFPLVDGHRLRVSFAKKP